MIQIEGLTKYYNDFCAVDHISLEIEKGEILGLLGPNGAGKTTTLRMLTGYYTPTQGTIKIDDCDVAENPLQVKSRIGYLPESAPLYHSMLVYDYLAYVAGIKGIPGSQIPKRLKELSDLCGLSAIMHKTINELSKGLKQRVGLAHAMMSDPDVLILDEPTSGLDPNQIVEIRRIIREIGKEKTVIFSTHILSEAEATCDRIVIINKGNIVADDKTEALKNAKSGGSNIQITLVDADEAAVRQRLSGIPGVRDITITDTGAAELQVTLSCGRDNTMAGAIYRSIRETDWTLTRLEPETRNLETIFHELTREN